MGDDCGGDCGDCGGDCGDCGDCDCGDCNCGDCNCDNCNCGDCECHACDCLKSIDCCGLKCGFNIGSCDCLKSCDCFKSCDCCGLECDCSCFKSCDILGLCGCKGDDGTCNCCVGPAHEDHHGGFKGFFCFCCEFLEIFDVCCFANGPAPTLRTNMPPGQQVMYRGELPMVNTQQQRPEADTTIDPDMINVDPDPPPQPTESTSQV